MRVNTNENGCAGIEFFSSFLFQFHSLCLFLRIPFPSRNPLRYKFTQLMIFPSLVHSRSLLKKRGTGTCRREQLRTSALQVELYTGLKIYFSFYLFSFFPLVRGPIFLLYIIIPDIIKYRCANCDKLSEQVTHREFIYMLIHQS